MQQFLNALFFLLIFLALVMVTQVLYRRFKLPSESTRKFLHVSGGILSLFAPLFIQSHWWILGICSAAFLLLLITYYKKRLPAVHQTKRNSIGSVLFPIPLYLCFVVATKMDDLFLFYVPVSFLTLSDTAAEWGGHRWGHYAKPLMGHQKTVMGSLCFALCSLLLAWIWGAVFRLPWQQMVFISLTTALLATAIELISTKGLDNITVPVVTLLWLLTVKAF